MEIMWWSKLALSFGFSGFTYLIIALQVNAGFPPFYRKWGSSSDKDIKAMLPTVFLLMVSMVLLAITEHPIFLVALGGISIWRALRVRSDLLKDTGGPFPSPFLPFGMRYPMLLFDCWTLGIALGFALLIYFGWS